MADLQAEIEALYDAKAAHEAEAKRLRLGFQRRERADRARIKGMLQEAGIYAEVESIEQALAVERAHADKAMKAVGTTAAQTVAAISALEKRVEDGYAGRLTGGEQTEG